MKPKRLIAYRIVEDFQSEMARTVLALVGEGWELLGCAQPLPRRDWYAQTLVMYDRESK